MKKKILTVLAILGLLLAATVCASAADAETPKVIQPGDVNGDGEINAVDLVLLSQYIAGWDVILGGDSHTVVIDPAVPATCTQTGLTEGKHCSDCGMILVKQQIVPTTEHDYEDTIVPPTETEKGYTFHKCRICGHEMTDSFTGATLAKGLAYTIENGLCTITGIGTCTETEIHIPETIENCPVVAIADKAFADQTQITKIGLPSTMETLGQRAFYGCTGLTEFTVPASVTSVGHQVFYKCDNLATVYYNSSFSPDQDKVFLNIPSIKTVVFGGTVVPGAICYNCTNIETVEILDNVKRIETKYYNDYIGAFYGCASLKEVKIGDSVTSIGSSAFGGCSSLTSVEIPDSVTSIGSSAFWGCSSLTNVEIPDSVTSIGYGVFCKCSSLVNITIPGSISNIPDGIYYSYPRGMFAGCTSLEIVVIENGVTSIGDYAFYGCSSLTSVEILDSVTSIGDYAFQDCSSLTSVEIPDSVTSIGGSAFYNCSSLKNLYITDLESWLNVSLFGWESHPLSSAGGNLYIDGILATDIEIPDTVTSIGNYSFCGCSSLTSIEIPDSVTSIGDDAFWGCSSLTSVEIPDSVTSIGEGAFYNCSSLISVEIGDSVTSIGSWAFDGCSSITSVYYGGDATKWAAISISNDYGYNDKLLSATRYYYSATQPTTTGNYWRYVDGKPTPW